MHVCPNCGYCPHCGRGGYRPMPWYPQPYWPWYIWTTTPTGAAKPITITNTYGSDLTAGSSTMNIQELK